MLIVYAGISLALEYAGNTARGVLSWDAAARMVRGMPSVSLPSAWVRGTRAQAGNRDTGVHLMSERKV